jgi:hypothetical protein
MGSLKAKSCRSVHEGKPVVTNGPFADAKETLGGFWMIQVNSREEAIEWAKRCPASDNEIIEIRQVQEITGVGLYVAFIDTEGNQVSMLQPARS